MTFAPLLIDHIPYGMILDPLLFKSETYIPSYSNGEKVWDINLRDMFIHLPWLRNQYLHIHVVPCAEVQRSIEFREDSGLHIFVAAYRNKDSSNPIMVELLTILIIHELCHVALRDKENILQPNLGFPYVGKGASDIEVALRGQENAMKSAKWVSSEIRVFAMQLNVSSYITGRPYSPNAPSNIANSILRNDKERQKMIAKSLNIDAELEKGKIVDFIANRIIAKTKSSDLQAGCFERLMKERLLFIEEYCNSLRSV